MKPEIKQDFFYIRIKDSEHFVTAFGKWTYKTGIRLAASVYNKLLQCLLGYYRMKSTNFVHFVPLRDHERLSINWITSESQFFSILSTKPIDPDKFDYEQVLIQVFFRMLGIYLVNFGFCLVFIPPNNQSRCPFTLCPLMWSAVLWPGYYSLW